MVQAIALPYPHGNYRQPSSGICTSERSIHMLLAKTFCGAFHIPLFSDLSTVVQLLSIISGQCEHNQTLGDVSIRTERIATGFAIHLLGGYKDPKCGAKVI